MIRAIGIDLVEIDRFTAWSGYSRKMLSRLFSPEEIDYCLMQKNKSAERFAVRFAAREAFFKALSAAYPLYLLPFLTVAKSVIIKKENGRPIPVFDWSLLDVNFTSHFPTIHLSLSHTKTVAAAYVIIEE